MAVGPHGEVLRVNRCSLHRDAGPWAFARTHAAAIEAHWQQRLLTNPGYFNGVIHVMQAGEVAGGTFNATFLQTDFKSFLYWRESGYPEAAAFDAFGSAMIRSCEGHVLLGRQRAGNINAGLAYLPGGFIDSRDILADEAIDIAGSIARELSEETGLTPAELAPADGFLLVRTGPLVSIIREFRSHLTSAELRHQILARLSAEPDSELVDIIVIRSLADLDDPTIQPYAAMAITEAFTLPDVPP